MEMEPTEAQRSARATWSAGDFDVVAERIWAVGDDLAERAAVKSGEVVLDVACGTGNCAIPAAVAGADVVGLDITPELFEAGRRRATEAGVEVEWVEGDAQALPYDDASFDVVLSSFGCMFAPDQGKAAAEIARVLKPGGRAAIAAWRPDGSIGGFFQAVSKHAPPPPPGFTPPPMWGVRDHVSGLFADTGLEISFDDAAAHWHFDSVEEAVEEYGTKFGPVVMLRAALEPEGKWEALRDDLTAYFEEVSYPERDGVAFEGDYLITLGRKS